MDIIDTYYEILGAFDADRLRAIVADDLRFEGPIAGERVGAEPFIAGAEQFARAASEITMLRREPTAALYDAVLPAGTVRFAEFFAVADGRIRALWLHYDPAAFRAAMAM